MKDWPYATHPTGWYQIGYTEELKTGDLQTVKYFGDELVLFRTESGKPVLMDAYCRHLGAHLGHGGKVINECIVCPWHGWQWSADGENAHIPYSQGIRNQARMKTWSVREIDGILIAWYDALDRSPMWEWPGVPEFRDTAKFYPVYPHGVEALGARRIKPQSPAENTPDYQHFVWVHGSGSAAQPISWHEDGPLLLAKLKLLFGEGHESTFMTPNGPEYGTIESELWGLGLGMARLEIGEFVTAHLVCATPVDDEFCQMFSTVASSRVDGSTGDEPTGFAKVMIKSQHGQIANDFEIWEHQKYVTKPLYAGKEERRYADFRKWAHQFYPEFIK